MSRSLEKTGTLTVTSPSTAGTTISGTVAGNFQQCDVTTVTAILTGATGGTLDVLLQFRVAPNIWVDWAHFAQLTAAQAKTVYQFSCGGTGEWIMFGSSVSTDATVTGTPIAADVNTNMQPSGPIRVVFISGVGTTLGASQTIIINSFRDY